MAVLSEFGIGSVGEVMDPDSALALDDAVRAHEPGEVLLSCLQGTRFGIIRKDLVEWARTRFEPETAVTHIPVRIEDDSIRWDVIHTLVVATKTVATPDLVTRLTSAPRRARIATRSSARALRGSLRPRSSATSPRPWPSSTAPMSTRPACR